MATPVLMKQEPALIANSAVGAGSTNASYSIPTGKELIIGSITGYRYDSVPISGELFVSVRDVTNNTLLFRHANPYSPNATTGRFASLPFPGGLVIPSNCATVQIFANTAAAVPDEIAVIAVGTLVPKRG